MYWRKYRASLFKIKTNVYFLYDFFQIDKNKICSEYVHATLNSFNRLQTLFLLTN
jgi:predicted KAP-like P-loop ATPase